MKTIYQYQLEEMNQQSTEESNHADHGRDEESGPWYRDCICRGSDKQKEYAKQRCGFCRAAEKKNNVKDHRS